MNGRVGRTRGRNDDVLRKIDFDERFIGKGIFVPLLERFIIAATLGRFVLAGKSGRGNVRERVHALALGDG